MAALKIRDQAHYDSLEPRVPASDWQSHRAMSPDQFLSTIHRLGLSQAACGRYLGVSTRTVARYATGLKNVPTASVLLLRACLVLGIKPRVPNPTAEKRALWRAQNRARALAKLDSG